MLLPTRLETSCSRSIKQESIGITSSPLGENTDAGLLHSLESILWKHIPEGKDRDEVSRLVYGAPASSGLIPRDCASCVEYPSAKDNAFKNNFDLDGVYAFQPSAEEQTRESYSFNRESIM